MGNHGRHASAKQNRMTVRGHARCNPIVVILAYLLRSPSLFASAALLAALLLARTLSGQPLMNGENMQLALAYLPTLQTQFEAGAYDTAPNDLRELLEGELSALQDIERASADQAASGEAAGGEAAGGQRAPAQAAAKAYARYLAIQEEEIRLGYLQEGDDAEAALTSTAAERVFYERLSSLPDAQVYETTREEPLLNALCDGMLSLPALLWYLPAVIAVAGCADLRARGRMLAQAPSIRREARDEILAAWLAALLASWCAALPTCAIALVSCGFGSPSYPVVCVWGGEVISRTVLQALGSAALLHALGSLLVIAVGTLASLLARETRLGALVAGGGLLGAASVFLLVVPAQTASALPSLLPLPYLTVSLYVPRPQCAYFQELQPLAGTSLARGLAVQAVWAVGVLAAFLFAAGRTRRNS